MCFILSSSVTAGDVVISNSYTPQCNCFLIENNAIITPLENKAIIIQLDNNAVITQLENMAVITLLENKVTITPLENNAIITQKIMVSLLN